ncbi:hypothetical protein RMATCC62417_13175 [Rhizopus microsporus]|nr:hypothetical protein RMATCC62417_13175 [Rhizopus microsporus]
MFTDISMKDLKVNDEDDEYETSSEVYVSLMTMMRTNDSMLTKYTSTDIDQEVNHDLVHDLEAVDGLKTTGEELEEEEGCSNYKTCNEDIQKFANTTLKEKTTTKGKFNKTINERGTYRKYDADQIAKFISLIIEEAKVKQAANSSGITERSAYRFRKQWNEYRTVCRKQRGQPQVVISNISEAHRLYITSIVNENPALSVTIMYQLTKTEYPDLEISMTTFYRYIKRYCTLSFKRLEKIPEKRNSEDVRLQRREFVQMCLEDKQMGFEKKKNCVFLDEAGFNLHITRNRG